MAPHMGLSCGVTDSIIVWKLLHILYTFTRHLSVHKNSMLDFSLFQKYAALSYYTMIVESQLCAWFNLAVGSNCGLNATTCFLNVTGMTWSKNAFRYSTGDATQEMKLVLNFFYICWPSLCHCKTQNWSTRINDTVALCLNLFILPLSGNKYRTTATIILIKSRRIQQHWHKI